MNERLDFADLLQDYIRRARYSQPQLAKAANLPFYTIRNWVRGTAHPRRWEDVLTLAHHLELNEMEVDKLLRAADYPSLAALRRANPETAALLPDLLGKQRKAPTINGANEFNVGGDVLKLATTLALAIVMVDTANDGVRQTLARLADSADRRLYDEAYRAIATSIRRPDDKNEQN